VHFGRKAVLQAKTTQYQHHEVVCTPTPDPRCSREIFIELRKSRFSYKNMGNKEIILHFRRIHMIPYDEFIVFLDKYINK
jgi:hypothetical protein